MKILIVAICIGYALFTTGAHLKFDPKFPETAKQDYVIECYAEAVELARIGIQATQRPREEPFSRYFYENDAVHVRAVFQNFRTEASSLGRSRIRDVTIKDGATDDPGKHCRDDERDNFETHMYLRKSSKNWAGPGSSLIVCPSAFNVRTFLKDVSCNNIGTRWPRTTVAMFTSGATFLHEWLHYDDIAAHANGGVKIIDRKICDAAWVYGPYKSMLYSKPPFTKTSARDNDDNFRWMAVEAFLMNKCPGYRPQPPVDEDYYEGYSSSSCSSDSEGKWLNPSMYPVTNNQTSNRTVPIRFPRGDHGKI